MASHQSCGFHPKEDISPSCEKDHLLKQVEMARHVFVETSGYKYAKDYLNASSHLTLLGAPGSGKTTASLMLLHRYRKKKYNYHFIESTDDFDIKKVDTRKSNILVFDDFWGKSGLSDFIKWKRVLKDLDVIFDHSKFNIPKQKSTKQTTKNSTSDKDKALAEKSEGATSGVNKPSSEKGENATDDVDVISIEELEGATSGVNKPSSEKGENATDDVDVISIEELEGATSGLDTRSLNIGEGATSNVDKPSLGKGESATYDVDMISTEKVEGAISGVEEISTEKVKHATSDIDMTPTEEPKDAASDIDKTSTKKIEGGTSGLGRTYTKKEDNATSDIHLNKPDLKVIFTSRNHLFKKAEALLGEYKHTLMKTSNVVDLSNFTLNETERKDMLLKHAKVAGITLKEEDIQTYVSQAENSIGFPYSCKMFLKVNWFQKNPDKLFINPFVYFKDHLEELLLSGKTSGEASALVLTALGDGKLHLRDLNPRPGNTRDMEKAQKKLECLHQYKSMTNNQLDIKNGADSLTGTFLEIVEDTYEFSHPTLHDAVACIMGKHNPGFVLQHCSMKFLQERVHLENKASKEQMSNDYDFSITVPVVLSHLFVRRLADELLKYNFSSTFQHDAFSEEEFVDDVFKELQDGNDLLELLHTKDKTYGQSFLFWATFSSSSFVVQKCFEKVFEFNSDFEKNELLEGFLGCAISGNLGSLDIIIENSTSFHDRVLTAKLKDILSTKTHAGKLIRSVIATTDNSHKSDHQNPFLGDNNDSLLHLASIHGHKDIVQRLLKLGCAVDTRGEVSRTPLMFASRVGHNDVVDALLKSGADAGLVDDEGARALHLAARGGHLDVMTTFLQNGVDIKMYINTKGSFRRTPLLYACRHGHKDFVQFCLDNGGDLTLKCDKDSCLHLACKSGNLEIVEILVNKGMNIEEPGEFGSTPILYACRHGNTEIINYLKKRGANLDIVDNRNEDMLYLSITSGNVELAKEILSSKTAVSIFSRNPRSPFVKASALGHYDMIKYFIDNRKEMVPISPCLMAACSRGHMPIIEMLVDLVDDIDTTDEIGRTSLLNACVGGQLEAAEFLISKNADFKHLDKHGDSCWKHACDSGAVDLVKQLMKKGFKVRTPCQNGMTSLMIACRRNHQQLFEFLLQKDRKAVHQLDSNGLSCLHHCCIGKHDCPKLVERLLDLELDVNCRDDSLKTPAMHACRNGLTEILVCLVEHGAHLKLTDKNNQNCLHYASWSNNVNNIKFVIDSGLEVNCVEERVTTPLMVASSKGNPEIVDFLLTIGAESYRKNTYDDSCVHIASRGRNIEVLQVFVDHGVDMEMKGHFGRTPFMSACQNGNMDIVEKLIHLKVNIFAQDDNGANSLHMSCMGKKDDYSVARRLIRIGMDVNSRDDNGMTPVMHACYHGHIKIFKFLYSKGANITLQDSRRRNCHKFASKRGYIELATKILEYL